MNSTIMGKPNRRAKAKVQAGTFLKQRNEGQTQRALSALHNYVITRSPTYYYPLSLP